MKSLTIHRSPSSLRKNSVNEKFRCDSRLMRVYGANNVSSTPTKWFHQLGNYTISVFSPTNKKTVRCNKRLIRPLSFLTSIAFIFYFLFSIGSKSRVHEAERMIDCGSAHETYNMSFDLDLKHYEQYAISVDNDHCSDVGKEIIQKGGSAVDAAISAGLCNGLMNSQSAGIGGGHFMVIYLKETNKAYAINARERATFNAFEDMFANKSSLLGGLATAVPGEIAGFAEAHRIGGRLPWRELFEPAIRMCFEGYPVSKALSQALVRYEEYIRADPVLAESFIDRHTQHVLKIGDRVHRPLLGVTLSKIADNGPEFFYDTALSRLMVDEINSNGGNISLTDFKMFKAEVSDALVLDLDDELKVATASLPSSGILTSFIMRIMKKFHLDEKMLDKGEKEGLFYHRLVESFKHAFAHRALLGDEPSHDIAFIMEQLKDESYVKKILAKIDDTRTFPSEYYSKIASVDDHGTAHISVLVGGDAVSLTSTINTYFGAKYAGRYTGIIYNNQMDDFSTPNKPNYFDLQPSVANYIRPGKRPMSSMAPLIVIDKHTNEPRLVLGASGGSKIITAVAQVAIKTLWMDMDIKEAIDDRRVHHQLYPPEVQIENGFDWKIHEVIADYGHNVSCYEIGGSIIQAVHKIGNHKLLAYSDPRKGGVPAGA